MPSSQPTSTFYNLFFLLECLEVVLVANGNLQQHIAVCEFSQITSNLDYFYMGPSGCSTWKADLPFLHMCAGGMPVPVLI